MYSGLLPKGLTEYDLSSEDEDEQEDDVEEKRREGESSVEKLSSTGENTGSVVEAESTHAASDPDGDSLTCSLPGISQETWQVCRFSLQVAKLSIHSCGVTVAVS